MSSRAEFPALEQRLLEEARWGLEYVLKNNFGEGYRVLWATHDFWTNGIIGDLDDVTAEARNDPLHNFLAAAAEAIAFRLYRQQDPLFAGFCLETARSDWKYAVGGMDQQPEGQGMLDRASTGLVASTELLRATGEQQYAERAVELARTVISFQQREYFAALDEPLAGFFWESPARDYVLHQHHLSFMQAPILGLSGLCEVLPDHPEWIRWYTSVVLYCEYLKSVAKYTAPFNMLPASFYRDDEHLRLPEQPQRNALGYMQATREDFREQVLNGLRLGPNHYLRFFPVWFTRRGNHGTLLRQNKALAVAAHLRGDMRASQLAEKQLEWIVGRNPFSQSTMTGEGYDFVPHYTAMSGDIVGSLPVGIETLRNQDIPYWSVHNHMNPKETWVHPVTGWIWCIRELGGPGFVRVRVDPGSTDPVQFREISTGEVTEVDLRLSTGDFEARLPQGSYEVIHGNFHTSLAVLPGSSLKLDLRKKRLLDFSVSYSAHSENQIEIRTEAKGSGEHHFAIRSDNIVFAGVTQSIKLEPDRVSAVTWIGTIQSKNAPWVAVVIADHDIAQRREVVGLQQGGPSL